MTYPTDDAGNVQVDFVWGNFPLQPNQDRGLNTLDYSLDNHVIADIGWSNYPSFIPNYAGDEDADLEVVVPTLRGLARVAAQTALTDLGLVPDVQYYPNFGEITNVVSSGKTITITTSTAWGDDLRPGDVVSVYYNDGDAISGTWSNVKLLTIDGYTITFKVATAPSPALDFATTNSYMFNNDNNVVYADPVAGTIVNAGSTVVLWCMSGD